jgi:hypothetical protein
MTAARTFSFLALAKGRGRRARGPKSSPTSVGDVKRASLSLARSGRQALHDRTSLGLMARRNGSQTQVSRFAASNTLEPHPFQRRVLLHEGSDALKRLSLPTDLFVRNSLERVQ